MFIGVLPFMRVCVRVSGSLELLETVVRCHVLQSFGRAVSAFSSEQSPQPRCKIFYETNSFGRSVESRFKGRVGAVGERMFVGSWIWLQGKLVRASTSYKAKEMKSKDHGEGKQAGFLGISERAWERSFENSKRAKGF